MYLNVLTSSTSSILLDAELKAIAKLRTKMFQRYDMDYELNGVTAYSSSTYTMTVNVSASNGVVPL